MHGQFWLKPGFARVDAPLSPGRWLGDAIKRVGFECLGRPYGRN
jgi:hypothetical protein